MTQSSMESPGEDPAFFSFADIMAKYGRALAGDFSMDDSYPPVSSTAEMPGTATDMDDMPRLSEMAPAEDNVPAEAPPSAAVSPVHAVITSAARERRRARHEAPVVVLQPSHPRPTAQTADDSQSSWRSRRECRDAESTLDDPVFRNYAKAMCGRCAVKKDCLLEDITLGPAPGIRAGLTEDDRNRLKNSPKKLGHNSQGA